MQLQPLNRSQYTYKNLKTFEDSICNCLKCELGFTRKKIVYGAGNPCADIVFIGEAPGKKEDLVGEPFLGRSGKLLDNLIAKLNLTRKDIYICNLIKCRPPKNRNPIASEIKKCEPYLKTQLKLINPKLIVALGKIAACIV